MKSKLFLLVLLLVPAVLFAAPGYVTSSSLNYADGGWAGWSVPAGKVVTCGGFNLSGGPAAASVPATPSSIWPHYTFGANEYGWVVQDAPDGAPSTGSRVYAVYDDLPPGYQIVISPTMNMSGTGWAGWSAPAGKVVLGGGYIGTGPVAASAPATPGSVWPHYTFGANEYGWVVHNGGTAQSLKIYVICADAPYQYEVVKSMALNYGDGGWAGWSAPADKVVTGGGFQLSGNGASVSAPATPGSVWPHYTFGANEYGWVVRDDHDGNSSPGSFVYAICYNPNNPMNNNVGVGDATPCLTPSNACVTVPVTFNRLDTTASRGVSVTFQLSPELVLCSGVPETDIAMANGAGTWSGSFTNQWNEIVDNGGGSYTVDRAVMGSPCGPTNGGTLFNVSVAKAPGVTTDVTGTITVTAVDVRDCANAPLPGVSGAVGNVSINVSVPAALAGLTAVQQKTGNDGNGTTKINLAWTAPSGDADFITVWRKGYGAYPEYNDAGGAAPTGTASLTNGWTLVTTLPATSTGYADEPATRDFWYYAAYVSDECGNVSPMSAMTGGTLNYHLGDVHNTVTAGTGDNLVSTSDITLLGFYYGTSWADNSYAQNYLDVGPTTDRSVNALPNTDNRLQFEDLMVFSMNYDLVSKIAPQGTPADVNAVALSMGDPGAIGSTFDVQVIVSSDGRMQGLSVPLAWDSAMVEPVDMKVGNLLANQDDLALVLSPAPGTVDAALMGIRSQAIAGKGVLATVTFRVLAAGDVKVGLGNVVARDSANRPIKLNGAGGSLPPANLPAVSELRSNTPNPFNPSTEFSFVLAKDGRVTLCIYTLRGELVRTLVNQDMTAGPHAMVWNGADDQGRMAASGGYIARFTAPDRTQSRNITLLK